MTYPPEKFEGAQPERAEHVEEKTGWFAGLRARIHNLLFYRAPDQKPFTHELILREDGTEERRTVQWVDAPGEGKKRDYIQLEVEEFEER